MFLLRGQAIVSQIHDILDFLGPDQGSTVELRVFIRKGIVLEDEEQKVRGLVDLALEEVHRDIATLAEVVEEVHHFLTAFWHDGDFGRDLVEGRAEGVVVGTKFFDDVVAQLGAKGAKVLVQF